MASGQRIFHFVMIKPSHYHDDGYVIQWLRSAIPSNSLACLYGLATDAKDRSALGEDVDIRLTAIDECNTRIRPDRIARMIRRDGGSGLVGLVGVQSNQFPRAMDIARQLRALGIQVCIGGFHVSGCLAMLPEVPPEIQEATDLGISIFAGEAEGGLLDVVLRDAWRGELKPLYNQMSELPELEGAPAPFLPPTRVKRTAGRHTSFDAGRGCPFQCSFCTIINVQGRKSRHRNADDVERIIRGNVAKGVNRFFISDDNFARNREWEPIFDRLIELREDRGFDIKFTIQVDTLCHRMANFIEKAGRAGVARVFIGLENINPDNLISAKKRQNKITEYRKMLQMWKDVGAITYAGYIIGFPADTPESVARDIDIIKRELPVDLLEFFYLTPLPGSEDHKKLYEKDVWMDGDLNKYDLNHVTTTHANMSAAEWEGAYWKAWADYYTDAHMETVMRRAAARGVSVGKMMFLLLWFYTCIHHERIHPLEGGYLRMKYRRDRRPDMARESIAAFYAGFVLETIVKHVKAAWLIWHIGRVRKRIKADPGRRSYQDLALTPVNDAELDTLDMFRATAPARAAVERTRKHSAIRASVG